MFNKLKLRLKSNNFPRKFKFNPFPSSKSSPILLYASNSSQWLIMTNSHSLSEKRWGVINSAFVIKCLTTESLRNWGTSALIFHLNDAEKICKIMKMDYHGTFQWVFSCHVSSAINTLKNLHENDENSHQMVMKFY